MIGLQKSKITAIVAVILYFHKPKSTSSDKTVKNIDLSVGQIVTRKWLLDQGYSNHRLDNQLKSGKLKLLVKGVYTHPDTNLKWQTLAVSLPKLLSQPVSVGGLTALSQQGLAQYANPGGTTSVDFFSSAACPGWIKLLSSQLESSKLNWQTTNRLWQGGWPQATELKELTWIDTLPPILLSSPEQAFFELLMGVPKTTSFEHADQIMQGLTHLSPKKLSLLLKNCINVKVKRLFFWFSDRHLYAWRTRLNVDDYNLGSGKRVLAEGGTLDKSYQITVPGYLVGEEP